MKSKSLLTLTGKYRLLTVTLLFTILAVGFLSFAEYSDSVDNEALAKVRYDHGLTNYRISSLDGLVDLFTARQFQYLGPLLPGVDDWTDEAGVYPVDWLGFPPEILKNLAAYWEGNVPVYEIYLFQTKDTREIVLLNADAAEIYSIKCPYDEYCDPATYALATRPDLYSGNYSKEEIEYYIAHMDPARVSLVVKLVPTDYYWDYVFNQVSQQSYAESLGGGGQMMMSQSEGGSGALNDLDGDGISNRDEILSGTDPTNAFSYLRITNMIQTNATREMSWLSASNREYRVERTTTGLGLVTGVFTTVTQWLDGTGSGLIFTDATTSIMSGFLRVRVQETDSNSNGVPDWFEYEHFGSLTNIAASGDEDGDGLDNLEEVYYGYDPQKSERDLLHAIFKSVAVSNNVPSPGPDDDGEFFDFHGGGRPMGLASNGVDGFGVIAGEGFSGGCFFNSDMSNLYVGISGVKLAGPHALAIFIDADTGGQSDLSGLSGTPYGFGRADNINFAAGFTPEVGLLLGDRSADGRNYTANSVIGHQSWAMWATTGNYAAAEREFETALAVNQSFGIDIDNGWIENGYTMGIELKNGSDENRFGFIFRGGDSKYKLQDNGGDKLTALDWTAEGVQLKLTLTAANTYSLEAIRIQDGTTFVTNGTLSGTSGSSITKVRVYNGGTGNGENYDLYVNNLRIGPHSDSASDPAVPNWWDPNAASGSGFENWSLSSSASGAGHFVGQSTNNANHANSNGDLDIDGEGDFGQGAWYLSDNSSFNGFSTSSDSPISQWARDYTGDDQSAHAGIEVALSLDELGADPGDTIKIAMVFLGDTDGTNRWVSPEVYGKSVTLPSNWGYDDITIEGTELQLGSPQQTLPPNTYTPHNDDDVMFIGFHWDVPAENDGPRWWVVLSNQVPELANAGFTSMWLPPPYKGANKRWSVGYDPFDHWDLGEYTQDNVQRTRYGFKGELDGLLSALLATNITPICDIVLNHMAGGSGGDNKTFTYSGHTNFQKSAMDFHPSEAGHNDELFPYHNNNNFGDPNDYPLDVDNLSPNMRLGFKQWGEWLVISNGFQYFRLDFTEGVPPWVPWEWLNYPALRGSYVIFEYWENADGVEMHEWLELTGYRGAIYDWNLRDHYLKPMCEDNGSFDMRDLEAPSLLGRCPEWTAILFDNHDTWREGATNEFGQATKQGITTNLHMALGYGFHSQGHPMVFYPHYFLKAYLATNAVATGTNYFHEINRLVKIRKAAVAGEVETLYSDTDLYIQLRTGSAEDSASILTINDSPTTYKSQFVQTPWTNTPIVDLYATNSAHTVTTDGSGYATLGAPAQGFRIYAPTNVLSQIEE